MDIISISGYINNLMKNGQLNKEFKNLCPEKVIIKGDTKYTIPKCKDRYIVETTYYDNGEKISYIYKTNPDNYDKERVDEIDLDEDKILVVPPEMDRIFEEYFRNHLIPKYIVAYPDIDTYEGDVYVVRLG